jgi:hypothetical protein
VAPGTVLGLSRRDLAATGNATVGIFGGGDYTDAANPTDYTDIYTYSGNGRTSGTVLGLARYALAATGNATVGIFGGGLAGGNSFSTNTDIYTYPSNSRTTGAALGLLKYQFTATSSSPGGF